MPTDCRREGLFEDLNNNGLADIHIDCDDDGRTDPIEIEKGAPDTNQNGIPDDGCGLDGDGIWTG